MSDGKNCQRQGPLARSGLLNGNQFMVGNQSGNVAACFCRDMGGCPASACDRHVRLAFSGMLLTTEDCSFENWFAGRTPQMRESGKQELAQRRECGFPSLGESSPGNSGSSLLDYSLGVMCGVLLSTTRMSHAEERASGVDLEQHRCRAPRHWLDPLVGPFCCRSTWAILRTVSLKRTAPTIRWAASFGCGISGTPRRDKSSLDHLPGPAAEYAAMEFLR